MTTPENPLNAPFSDSIQNGELSLKKLDESGVTFNLTAKNPNIQFRHFWIGDAKFRKEHPQQLEIESSVSIPKRIVKTWLGQKLFAQNDATQDGTVFVSPETHFTVIE